MAAIWQRDTAPSRSYEVCLTSDGDVAWAGSRNGVPVRYDREPEASFWRRLTAQAIGLLPLESQL